MVSLWLWVLVPVLLAVGQVFYNVFLHPLAKFPGPVLAGAMSWWKVWKEVVMKETLAQELFILHNKYGDIVRVGPNELHFGKPSAFHEIYSGSRRGDKDPDLYGVPGFKSGSFVFLKYHQAKERRDVLLPMFSKKAMENVEALVWRNATHLASSIAKMDSAKASIDLLYAFRSFTLDTIMSFTFGNCVDALDAPAFSDPLILAMDATLPILPFLKKFPTIRRMAYAIPASLVMNLLPNSEKLAPRLYLVRDIVHRELQTVLHNPEKLDDAPHQTIFHRMLDAKAHKSKVVPNLSELHDEGFTLIFAGANTVADTMLMGHYNMLQHPQLLAQLKQELAIESLRFIPSGVSLTRVIPPGGAVIAGKTIPAGTVVGMAILHVHMSEEVFKDAYTYKPERWLTGTQGSKELDQWLVAFSRGPRMCFGVNLAWAELYVAFATMIRNFDMTLDGTTPEDMEWRECIAAYYPNRHLHAWCQPVES
ncbi:cytochrome P450 [Cercophora scortea]|uniref:Cytochrome P450 n=1 Tax=Cercophora scortea TaxID=314031 RepID=A0AAE0MMC6_9PEZI|nr:cytochrome P450 [Cercophora scortea]